MEKMDWEIFWSNYRNIESSAEEDLFFQVGKTIDKLPISNDIFVSMIENISVALQLKKTDILLEMCCGNGLLTKPLSRICKEVYAFDFMPHLIETARKFKQNDNIVYKTGNAKLDFFKLFSLQNQPNKFLMNDSLGYFTPIELKTILRLIISKTNHFSFYITGIPSDELKWNFYNTPERKEVYLQNVQNNDESNNGMGRWWKNDEFIGIADDFKLEVSLKNQPETISNYRINVLFETK